jgi:hypothetical protein
MGQHVSVSVGLVPNAATALADGLTPPTGPGWIPYRFARDAPWRVTLDFAQSIGGLRVRPDAEIELVADAQAGRLLAAPLSPWNRPTALQVSQYVTRRTGQGLSKKEIIRCLRLDFP